VTTIVDDPPLDDLAPVRISPERPALPDDPDLGLFGADQVVRVQRAAARSAADPASEHVVIAYPRTDPELAVVSTKLDPAEFCARRGWVLLYSEPGGRAQANQWKRLLEPDRIPQSDPVRYRITSRSMALLALRLVSTLPRAA
jgi:hypothetical protein